MFLRAKSEDIADSVNSEEVEERTDVLANIWF